MSPSFDPYHQWLGIPPQEQPPHFYRLLGVAQFEENTEVIRSAAARQMTYLRTLQTGAHQAAAAQMLNEVAAAKVCLLNPDKKAEYDQGLREQQTDFDPPPANGPPGPPAALPVAQPAEIPIAQPADAPLESFGDAHKLFGPSTPAIRVGAPKYSAASRRRSKRSAPVFLLMSLVALSGLLLAGLFLVFGLGINPFRQDRAENSTGGEVAQTKPQDASDSTSNRRESKTKPTGSTKPTENVAKKNRSQAPPVQPDLSKHVASPSTSQATENAAKLRRTGHRRFVYLDDLQETDFGVGVGTLGKHGALGYGKPPGVVFAGRPQTHALSLHPVHGGRAFVSYTLDGGFRSFTAVAGISHRVENASARSPLVFRVFGDGELLWQSRAIQRVGGGQEFKVDIRRVKTLRLEVQCPGDTKRAYACWIQPQIWK